MGANLHQANQGFPPSENGLVVKCLMNHTILKDATNVELLCTHTRGRGSIKVE